MDILIRETGITETFYLIDPNNGLNWAGDFIGTTNAYSDGSFEWDEEKEIYVCDQETYDWWLEVITEEQDLDDRTCELTQEHGANAVIDAINTAGNADFKDQAAYINRALDEAFGE